LQLFEVFYLKIVLAAQSDPARQGERVLAGTQTIERGNLFPRADFRQDKGQTHGVCPLPVSARRIESTPSAFLKADGVDLLEKILVNPGGVYRFFS
jgi:hypothetical protein